MQSDTQSPMRPLSGIVLVDKPAGVTSNRILQTTKRLFRARKAGHTGTLDPMATGMLPICFGAATKVSGLMLAASKRYRVTAAFGIATDTADATGAEIERNDDAVLSLAEIEPAVTSMIGAGTQIPPMYSAVKHEGRRLYELARQGRQVSRAPREIEIFELTVEAFDWPELTLSVHCSKGTYVRSIVTDLARDLGTVAHVTRLRRLSVTPFEEDRMVDLATLEAAAAEGLDSLDRFLLGPDAALIERPAVAVSEGDAQALRHGRAVPMTTDVPRGFVRLYDASGAFIGIGDPDESGMVRPVRIFPP